METEKEMSNYCDFNPKLFKPFTSKKKKIIPTMSDDWEIINESFRGDDGLGIGSAKLNSEIHDIPVSRFLRFCKEQNISIVGNVLQGSYIVGNDRSIYTQEMFDKWKAKFDVRTEVIIKPVDYKVGHKYKTPCGMEVTYLGVRYMSKIKNSLENFHTISNITKKHFIAGFKYAEILKQKFTKDLGVDLTVAEAEQKLTDYFNNDTTISYFSTTNIKDPHIWLYSM